MPWNYVTLSLPWKSRSRKLFIGHRKGKWKRKKTLLESQHLYMGKWCLGCLLSLYAKQTSRSICGQRWHWVLATGPSANGASTISLLFMSRILRALHTVLNQFVVMKPKLRISVPSGLYHLLCPYLFALKSPFLNRESVAHHKLFALAHHMCKYQVKVWGRTGRLTCFKYWAALHCAFEGSMHYWPFPKQKATSQSQRLLEWTEWNGFPSLYRQNFYSIHISTLYGTLGVSRTCFLRIQYFRCKKP